MCPWRLSWWLYFIVLSLARSCNTSHPRGSNRHKNCATFHHTHSTYTRLSQQPTCGSLSGWPEQVWHHLHPSVLSSPGECVPLDKPPSSRFTLTPRGHGTLPRVPLNLYPSDHIQQNIVPWTLRGGVSNKHACVLTGSLVTKMDKCVSSVQNLRTFILATQLWIIQRGQWCVKFPKLT